MSDPLRCETCGRRVNPQRALRKRGSIGGLVIHRDGATVAYCPEHYKTRPARFERWGWAYMARLDALWAKAEQTELLDRLKNEGRDLTFIGRPPLEPGQTVELGKAHWCVVEWVREPKPGQFTVRVRRFANEKPRMLRTGTLPHTDPKRERSLPTTPDVIAEAAIDSAYRTGGDPLDAGQVPPCDVGKLPLSLQAKARYAEVQAEVNSERIAEQQGKQLMRRMRRLQQDATKYGVDLSPALIGMIREAEREIGEARREAA